EALVHGDLGHGALVVAVLCGVALGDHGVAGVLAHVAVGQVEFGFRCTVLGAVATETHGSGHGRRIIVRAEGCHALRDHAEHGLADTQLDGSGGAPDHAHGGGAAQVHDLGEIQCDA